MVTLPTTTEAPPPPSQAGPKPESLSHIDITKLSQSELHALSLCSDSAVDLHPSNDVVIPKLNPSFFNASSASRRQTFSRHHHHSAALRRHLPNPKPLLAPLTPDPEHAENRTIVHFLKELMGGGKIDNPPPRPVVQEDMQMAPHSGSRKRKRGQGKLSDNPPAGVVPISNTRLEIVNKNGVVVDLKALSEKGDEFYSGEFRRRCEGLQSEEAFLGFLGGIEGQWGSRRKRRRIVSACEFGDWLPIDWKLLLGLKRKDGLVSVYCRKCIRWSYVYILFICGSLLYTVLYRMRMLSKSYNSAYFYDMI